MQPLLDMDGQPKRLLGQVQNITEQHQTDALIRWRTELLNRVSALGRIGGCEIEVQTRSMQWTEECYRIHGLRRNRSPRPGVGAVHGGLAQRVRGGTRPYRQRRSPEQLDLCFYRQSGLRVWCRC